MLMKSLKSSLLALVMLLGAAGLPAAEVNLFGWSEYIPQDVLDGFTKETGITVNFETYASNEELLSKLVAGGGNYDLVQPSEYAAELMIRRKMLAPLDRAKLTNLKNIGAEFMGLVHDPEDKYTVPYMWGTTGLTVNLDMVKERAPDAPVDTMDIIFKPELISKLADCGINILESPSDAIPMALAYLGRDPNSESVEDLEAAVKLYEPIRQYIKTFDAANYLNALPNSELCVSMTWSGDYATSKARAKEAGLNLNLAYNVPKSGAGLWVDVWAIPKDAPHPEAATAFINYMMDPEVAAKCVNYTNYASGVGEAARKFINKDVLEDPAVYPSDDIMRRLWVQKTASQDYERLRTEAWSRIKTGS